MRILIDAMAVGEGRGGIVTYLRGLLRGWYEAGFDDELAVVGTSRLPREIDEVLGDRGTVFRLGGAYPGSRFVAQHAGIPALARRWQPDVILTTTPVVPLLIWRRPVVAMVHDLRYLHRPAEFGRLQRWYRTVMYRRGIRRARRLVTNSLMTERDVIAAFPDVAAKIETVYLGCDQLAHPNGHVPTGSHALAYAHWTNKQPDVSICAWGVLNSTIDDFGNILHIVGVSPHDRQRLDDLIDQCGVRNLVQLHDYLDDETYRRLFSSARLLLMPSTFEGFGLPIVEAMRLQVAVVASDNAGMHEAGGAFALYAPADSPEAFARQCARLLRDDDLRQSLVAAGRRHAEQFTWRRTAERTRDNLVSATLPRNVKRPPTMGAISSTQHLGASTAHTVQDSDLHALLACPACRGGLVFGPDDIRCRDCGRAYPIVDGIPLLLPDALPADAMTPGSSPPPGALDAHKQQQIEFFNEEDAEFEITRPHGTVRLYQWLLGEKFRRGVQALPAELAGRTALTVCGGSGMDAEYLARAGAAVIASDLSLGAAQRTRERAGRFGLSITPIVADVERLPFADRAIDLVYVHDGLHHLERPALGLAEMARVAARAVSINEPARAAATAMAVRLGLAQQVEEAGNRVERLEPAEIAALLRERGFEVVHAERYSMLYRHRPGPVFAALSIPGLFALTRLGWRAANTILGPIGNKLTVQAIRLPEGGK